MAYVIGLASEQEVDALEKAGWTTSDPQDLEDIRALVKGRLMVEEMHIVYMFVTAGVPDLLDMTGE